MIAYATCLRLKGTGLGIMNKACRTVYILYILLNEKLPLQLFYIDTKQEAYLIQLSVAMSLERHGAETADSDYKNTLSYAVDESKLNVEAKQELSSTIEENVTESGETIQEDVDQQKRTAKIHDFCLGIPFGKCCQ